MRMGKYRRPIFGHVVHKAPPFRMQDVDEKNKAFEEVARLYDNLQRQTEPRRKLPTFRLPGGGHFVGYPPQSGSFQHLKVRIIN